MEQQVGPQFSGSVQFHHQNSHYSKENRCTACLVTPDEAAIKYSYTTLTTLNTKFGLAKVNPKDNYVKSKGREVSFNKLQDVVLVPVRIDFENKRAEMRVKGTNNIVTLVFGNPSGKVYFVQFTDWTGTGY